MLALRVEILSDLLIDQTSVKSFCGYKIQQEHSMKNGWICGIVCGRPKLPQTIKLRRAGLDLRPCCISESNLEI